MKPTTINIGAPVDVQRLLETRMLIQASSGGGKSYLTRKLAEELCPFVQTIILDLEGEFVTLREKFNFALVSKDGGDIPLSIKYAEILAKKLMETRLNAIIDLSELTADERPLFVKKFLSSLINLPKNLWHSCAVIVDEAHHFCPESSKSESAAAVVDLCTRGRKRGLCAILATQRLSKLRKDAAAECLNKLIGLTGLDSDRKRAGEELGFATKQDALELRKLKAGEFFAFGAAISNEVKKIKVGKVQTTHIKAGVQFNLPKTPNAIKKILSDLQDMPQEAAKELESKQQMQAEITRLKKELSSKAAASTAKVMDNPKLAQTIQEQKQEISNLKQELNQKKNHLSVKDKAIKTLSGVIEKASSILVVPKDLTVLAQETFSPQKYDRPAIIKEDAVWGKKPAKKASGSGAMRILTAACQFYPNPISKARIGAIAGLSHTSGSFSTYMSTLRQSGWITGNGDEIYATEDGLQQVGEFEPLPTDPKDIIAFWCSVVKGSPAKILSLLAEHYPDGLVKERIGNELGLSHSSGSFSTYLSTLSTKNLIERREGKIFASKNLFE